MNVVFYDNLEGTWESWPGYWKERGIEYTFIEKEVLFVYLFACLLVSINYSYYQKYENTFAYLFPFSLWCFF